MNDCLCLCRCTRTPSALSASLLSNINDLIIRLQFEKSNRIEYNNVMKYAFVFASIVAIWAVIVLLAATTDMGGMFLAGVGIVMTLALFWVGFGKSR